MPVTIPPTGKPEHIGDLIQFVLTFTPPPSDPSGLVTAAQIIVERPNGTTMTVTAATQITPNVWRFVAPERCLTFGQYIVRANATAGMVRSLEFAVNISRSQITTPLP